MNFHIGLLLLCLACTDEASAQERVPRQLPHPPSWMKPSRRTDTAQKLPVRKAYKPKGYSNALTANLPGFTAIHENPAISGGPEYKRFIKKSGLFSINLAVYGYRTIGYTKEKGSTTTISGYQVIPAILYHPQGNSKFLDYSAGLALAAGPLSSRSELIGQSGRYQALTSHNRLTALLAQFNLTVHSTSAFVFRMHLSAGLLLKKERADKGLT